MRGFIATLPFAALGPHGRLTTLSVRGTISRGAPGHDAVILQGDIVPGHPSTTLHLKFLHNGIIGEFYQCEVTLDRAQGAPWHLANARPEAFPVVVVRTWAVPLFGTVGIDTVEGICS
jgi:hypothetical protein